jgi:hypothetical protein
MATRSRWTAAVLAAVLGIVAMGCTPPTSTGSTDTAAPVVSSVTVTPSSTTPGSTVTLSAAITDNKAVGTVIFSVFVPNVTYISCLGGNQATRTSGTAAAGVWSRTCTLPAAMNSGDYVVGVLAQDVSGNLTSTATSPTTTLTITGGTSDLDPPVTSALTATPSTVARGQTTVISATVTDATGTADLAFQILGPSSVLACYAGNSATLTSGTAQNGTWSVSCYVPGTTTPAVYQITPIARDALGNITNPATAPSITLTVT